MPLSGGNRGSTSGDRAKRLARPRRVSHTIISPQAVKRTGTRKAAHVISGSGLSLGHAVGARLETAGHACHRACGSRHCKESGRSLSNSGNSIRNRSLPSALSGACSGMLVYASSVLAWAAASTQ